MNWAGVTSIVPLVDQVLSYLCLDDILCYRTTKKTTGTGVMTESYLPHQFATMVLDMIRASYLRDRQDSFWLEYELWLHVHED